MSTSTLNEHQIVKALSQSGYRITQPRRAVVRTLLTNGGYLSPTEIWEQAQQYCPSVGLVTVYRSLDLLSRLGFARRIHTEEGCHGYAAANNGHRHHIVCRNCGAAVEFRGCDLSPFLDRVSRETGFVIEDHLLELAGLCPECQ